MLRGKPRQSPAGGDFVSETTPAAAALVILEWPPQLCDVVTKCLIV
jgi:hypothetical protein